MLHPTSALWRVLDCPMVKGDVQSQPDMISPKPVFSTSTGSGRCCAAQAVQNADEMPIAALEIQYLSLSLSRRSPPEGTSDVGMHDDVIESTGNRRWMRAAQTQERKCLTADANNMPRTWPSQHWSARLGAYQMMSTSIHRRTARRLDK